MEHEPRSVTTSAKFSVTTKNTEREAANLEVIEGFFTTLVKNKDPKAVAGYLADDFISHNPQVAGKEGMVDFATSQAEKQPAAGFVDVFHTVTKDDLVV